MPDYLPPPASLPPGSPVWAYLRDSGGPSQGESIDRQRDEIRAYCSRHGLILSDLFIDEARSGGGIDAREAFNRMIDQSADPNHPAGLLLWDFARFSRSLDDSGYYKAILRRNGLVIHSLTDPIPEGPYSRLVEIVIDIANEEKRRQVSRDTASGLRRIVEQYGAMPGPAPVGYQRQPIDAGTRRDGTPHVLHRWTIDPETAPLVLKAFEMRAAGATLNQVRVATGLFASKNSYTTFFNNTVYKGEMYYAGKTYPCEPIVTPELWDAVQRLGELRSRARYGPQSLRCVGSPHLLSGLAYCQECGGPLYGYNLMGERQYYICARSHRRHDCAARHIPGPPFESDVVRRLLEDVLVLENMLSMQAALRDEWDKRRSVLDRETAADKKKLAKLEKQITNLTRAVAQSGYSRALADALQTAERERDELEYKLTHGPAEPTGLHATPEQITAQLEQVRTGLQGDDPAAQKQSLRMVVSRILARRTDDQILAAIEYHLPESNIPTNDDGDIMNKAGGPEGIMTLLINIPIRRQKKHTAPLS